MTTCEHISQLRKGFGDIVKLNIECRMCSLSKSDLWLCLNCDPPSFFCSEDYIQHCCSYDHYIFYSSASSVYYCHICSFYFPSNFAYLRNLNPNKILGYTGLVNQGNTCYMNAALQCLNHIFPLKAYFLNGDEENFDVLFVKFKELINMMWGYQDSIKPNEFYDVFIDCYPHFTKNSQEDSQEFLKNLLSHLERSTVNPIIKQIFSGKLLKKTECKNCGYKVVKTEDISELTVPIPDSSFIKDSNDISLALMTSHDRSKYIKNKQKFFNRFFKSERLSVFDCLLSNFESEEMDEIQCDRCQIHTTAEFKFSIAEAPNYLILVFKRFRWQGRKGSKINKHVQLSTSLDLSYFCEDKTQDSLYDLFGVIEHSGNIGRGHYRAYVKNHGLKAWHIFDDHKISSISESDVLEIQPYIAFYKSNTQNRSVQLTSEGCCLPKNWVFMYQTLRNPGKIDFEPFLCQHSQLNSFDEGLVYVENEKFEEIIQSFGCDSIVLPCETCKNEHELTKCPTSKEIELSEMIPGEEDDEK